MKPCTCSNNQFETRYLMRSVTGLIVSHCAPHAALKKRDNQLERKNTNEFFIRHIFVYLFAT